MLNIFIAIVIACCIPAVRRDGLRQMALRMQPDEHGTRDTGDAYLSPELLMALPRDEATRSRRVCDHAPQYGLI